MSKFEDAMLSDLLESRGREGVFWLKWALGSASAFGDNRPSNFAFRRDIRSGIVGSSFLTSGRNTGCRYSPG